MQPSQPGYGYGASPGVPMQPPVGTPTPSTDAIRSISLPTIGFLGARASLPVLFHLLGIAHIHLGPDSVYEGIRIGLGLGGLILYFVWYARFNRWLRATRGAAGYSTGLAIGGWFIPFANMVIPYLSLQDAWRRATGKKNPLIVLWWLSYVLTTVLATVLALTDGMELGRHLSVETESMIFSVIGWTEWFAEMAAYGLWALFVRQLTAKAP